MILAKHSSLYVERIVNERRAMMAFVQKVRTQLTPKAFANFSPGLELATTLGSGNEKDY
jgi:hypothetical protein